MIECSACGWRHIVPCGRDDCPHDAVTHYATIARALDNAVANGCAEELSKMSHEDIAYDLARHDSDCERLPIEILKSGVSAWLSPQANKEDVDDRRQWTLDNIYTIARREVRRQEQGKPLRPEMWAHVLRLCEQVGCESRGVLRDNGGSV